MCVIVRHNLIRIFMLICKDTKGKSFLNKTEILIILLDESKSSGRELEYCLDILRMIKIVHVKLNVMIVQIIKKFSYK